MANNISRLHPEGIPPKRELEAILSQFPENMNPIAEEIREKANQLSPAGLEIFIGALREEVRRIMNNHLSFFSKIEALLSENGTHKIETKRAA